MTAKNNPMLRTLGCCARITGVLVVSSAPIGFAQQPVVTLGIPSARSAITVADSAMETQTGPVTPSTRSKAAPNASASDLPPIRVNNYTSAQIDVVRKDAEESVKRDPIVTPFPLRQSLPSPVTSSNRHQNAKSDEVNSNEDLIGAPGIFFSAFAEPISSTFAGQEAKTLPVQTGIKAAAPIATAPESDRLDCPPRMSDMPAGLQLSPTKWVHQPLVARSVNQHGSANAVEPYAILQDEARTATQRRALMGQDDAIAQTPLTTPGARPLTEIRRAAMLQRATRPMDAFDAPTQTEPIQPGYSTEALRKTAMGLIAEAQLKIDIRAYMSAEEKAKKALELIAQSIDTREQSTLATRDLMISLTAIREAEDFVGKYGMVDGEMITRMVRSHSTEILKPYDTSKLNGLAAADVYLDWSRRCITQLAVADPLAAEAIRILAQSHRLREDGTPFGIATSVHLIRAAVEGSPDNQQVRAEYETTLQIAGLTDRTTIARAKNTVAKTDTVTTVSAMSAGWPAGQGHLVAPASNFSSNPRQDVNIIEVSPEQFAAISPAAAGPPGTPYAQSMAVTQPNMDQSGRPSSSRSEFYRSDQGDRADFRRGDATQTLASPAAASQETDNSVKGRLSRAFNPITRHLR